MPQTVFFIIVMCVLYIWLAPGISNVMLTSHLFFYFFVMVKITFECMNFLNIRVCHNRLELFVAGL